MRLAIMQPYFFPYLGYFQLIHAVDTFVIYDDVNFIKGGWVNRNYILGGDRKQLLTLPLAGASQNKLIDQVSLAGNTARLLKTIRQNYAKAPNFVAVFSLVEEVLGSPERNLARLLDMSLRKVCIHLGLQPTWSVSSGLNKDNKLRGEAKILDICETLGATHYINLPGGKMLYNTDAFADRGIKLSFIESIPVEYRQFGGAFVPNLSILDVMMFNDSEQCARLLREYVLV